MRSQASSMPMQGSPSYFACDKYWAITAVLIKKQTRRKQTAICLPNIFPWTTLDYCRRNGTNTNDAISSRVLGVTYSPQRWIVFSMAYLTSQTIYLELTVAITNFFYKCMLLA